MLRDKTNYLTEDEKNILRDCCKEGAELKVAAAKVNCSVRVVTKYYSLFRAEEANVKEIKPLPKRHYIGNFEL